MERKQLKQIRDYFKDNKKISAVYLFGSTAKAAEKKGSDIDIAVLLNPGINPYKPTDIQLRIMSDLETLLKKRVDVVLLGTADPILEHQIRKHGMILVDKAPEFRIDYVVESRKKYFDFLYRHNNYMKTLKNRILQTAK
ncbi:MAG: nucleotidyltransferase domain-containing protein [Nitrospirae bacterium]|nr:nucleotidyltransferase domain-containing protein [Nitrospirota bacterium]